MALSGRIHCWISLAMTVVRATAVAVGLTTSPARFCRVPGRLFLRTSAAAGRRNEITSRLIFTSQSSGTAKTGQFWRNEVRRAGNATLDLSLHASGFSLYVRGVAFGQRLRLFPGRVCLLIKGFFNRTRPLIGWATLPWLQRSLACSQHEWQHDVPPDANMNNSWRKLS